MRRISIPGGGGGLTESYHHDAVTAVVEGGGGQWSREVTEAWTEPEISSLCTDFIEFCLDIFG